MLVDLLKNTLMSHISKRRQSERERFSGMVGEEMLIIFTPLYRFNIPEVIFIPLYRFNIPEVGI